MINILLAGLKFIPTASSIGKRIYNFVKGNKGGNMKINEALQFQINNLRNQISYIEDINRRNEETIRILEELLDNNLEEKKRKRKNMKIKRNYLKKRKKKKNCKFSNQKKKKNPLNKVENYYQMNSL